MKVCFYILPEEAEILAGELEKLAAASPTTGTAHTHRAALHVAGALRHGLAMHIPGGTNAT